MGNSESAPPPVELVEEAEKICSVYRDSAQPHTKKAFEDAYQECLDRRCRAPGAAEAFVDRRKFNSLEGKGMTDEQIRTELERQARQYACAEERDAFEKATASSTSSSSSSGDAEQAFKACVAARTTDAEVEDYKDTFRRGLASHYAKQERNKELSNATRIHFSFGGM